MKLHLYQIIILAVSAAMLYKGIADYASGKSGQTFFKVFIRVVVWGGMSFVALFPGFTNTLAEIIGLEGNMNAVILSGFLLVFLMIFKLLSAIERLEQQLTIVTREKSLEKIKEKTN